MGALIYDGFPSPPQKLGAPWRAFRSPAHIPHASTLITISPSFAFGIKTSSNR